MGKKFTIGSFILGGLVGAAIGLLYAPRPGSETRAIVADKVDEIWGQGQTLYTQGRERIQDGFASVQPVISRKNDELREKIESARVAIADQVAKNAAAARDVINDKVPVAGEKIGQAVDVVRGQIDAAASRFKSASAQDADKPAVSGDAPGAASGPAAAPGTEGSSAALSADQEQAD
ncbi:MAG: YtxH domain-containing protein [Coriobacteriales bacterium]|jgi:gas vesicle protein|nr:YtxH domain-containing protein [Coriobacteriales bacterium]